MNNGVTTAHSTAEAARQAAVNAQEAADAWRKGSTPSAGPVYPYGLSQRRAIPDGYHFNYDNLETSIKDTHSAAEAARQAAVNAQEAADAWRKGSTPNAGAVLALNQRRNPADPDNYDTKFSTQEAQLKDRQDKYYARVLWGNQQEEEYNAWRGIPWTPTKKDLGLESLVQNKAYGVDDRDQGYYHSYTNMNNGVTTAHSDAEAARQSAVNA